MLEPITQARALEAGATHTRRPGAQGAEPDALPDLLLIERARSGDERAIEALVRRYSRRLFRVARSVLPDAERAESAVHRGVCRRLRRPEPLRADRQVRRVAHPADVQPGTRAARQRPRRAAPPPRLPARN